MTHKINAELFYETLLSAIQTRKKLGHETAGPFHMLQALVQNDEAMEMLSAIEFPTKNLKNAVDEKYIYFTPPLPAIDQDGTEHSLSIDILDIKKYAIEAAQIHNQPELTFMNILTSLRDYGDEESRFCLSEEVLHCNDDDFQRFASDEWVLHTPRNKRKAEPETKDAKEPKQDNKIHKTFNEAVGNSQKILEIPNALKNRVVGQDAAIDTLARCMKRAFVGMKEANKPVGSYLFAGPTGVGKTEVAKQLAEFLNIDLVRFDMSEFMQEYSVPNLIGAGAGLVGHDDGGLLTNALLEKPTCVLLLDEIEKAHPMVFDVLLQIMDNGMITDSSGKKVDCTNITLVMTSNVGVTDISSAPPGFHQNTDSDIMANYDVAIKKQFTAEFRNRIDKTVIFDHLNKDHMLSIANIFVQEMNKFVAADRYNISFSATQNGLENMVKKSYEPAMGARPLKRLMQNEIQDLISELLIQGQTTDTHILIDHDDKKQEFTIAPGAPESPSL